MDIADALIQALVDRDVKTVYGVPGDFVLGLFARFEASGIDLVCTAGEEGAAFAADTEARLNGLGVVMITYGVGALKIINAIAGAHAERSPVLVISGSPGVKERGEETLIHHSIYKHSDSPQRRIFQEVCVENASLDSANTAVQEIKKVLDGIKAFSRPGYLEVPRDRITRKLPFPMPSLTDLPQNLRMSAIEHLEVSNVHIEQGMKVLEWMRSKERPVVLAGVLLQRFNLQGLLMSILEREGWMCCTSLTAKTLIPESHPLSLGIYHGASK
jgi:TPP-dependent 2-oxoacid decarboxylase